jgi:hypothetical protein
MVEIRCKPRRNALVSTAEYPFSDIAEPAPQVAVLSQDKKSIIRHLEKTNPETLALARDWEDTALNLVNTQEKMAKFVIYFHSHTPG